MDWTQLPAYSSVLYVHSWPDRLKVSGPAVVLEQATPTFATSFRKGGDPRRQRIVFQIHLAFCRECRDYLGSYEQAIALGNAVFQYPDEAAPEDIPEALVRAILAARGSAEK